MSPPLAGPTPFWATVRLLLRFARQRSWARAQHNRRLLGNKGGSGTDWQLLAQLFLYVVAAVLHGGTALLLPGSVDVSKRVAVEATGDMVVSRATLEQVRRIEEGKLDRAHRENALRAAFHADRTKLEAREDAGPRSRALWEHYRTKGQAGFVAEDGLRAFGATDAVQPLAVLMSLLVVCAWFLTLALEGEGLDLDVQRRRHPMWEWLLGHPVDPRAVFLAEMVSPFAANPSFATAPLFGVVAFGALYGNALAGLVAGIPVAFAASCAAKAVEVVSFLALPVRSRGAVLGILSWLGQAFSVVMLFAVFTRGVQLALGRALATPATWFEGPLLFLASSLSSTAMGVFACWGAAATVVAVSVGLSGRATRRGLVGGSASAPDAPAALARPGAARLLSDPLHRKELLWLWRDRGAIVQVFLIPLTLAAFQMFQFRSLVAEATRGWHLMAGASVLLGSYFLAILGPRSLISEGAALWIPFTWPRSLEMLLRAKARLWWFVSCVVVVPLLLATAARFPAHAWKVALVGALWLVFARSLAEKTVTLVGAPTSSGDPEPVPAGRRWAALLGTFAFGSGVLTQQWALACSGVVFSWLTAAALWQNFRARLPYLLDPWSERLPTPPTVFHAMVAISAAVEVNGIALAVWALALGPEGLWQARAMTYGLVAIGVWLALSLWLDRRGVSASSLWRWTMSPTTWPRALAGGAVGIGVGVALGGVAMGYVRLVVGSHLFGLPEVGHVALTSAERWWLGVTTVALAPIGEEYLFRGLLFRALDREWGFQRAVLGSAVFFAIYHPPVAWLPVALVGAASAILFKRSGHLFPSVLLHMTYNLVVTLS